MDLFFGLVAFFFTSSLYLILFLLLVHFLNNFLIFNFNNFILFYLFIFLSFFLFSLPFLLSRVADRVLVLQPGVKAEPLR